MPEAVTRITVFVGSPGDVLTEKSIVEQTVRGLNTVLNGRGIILEPVTWETHVWPGFGEDAQDVINQRVGPYDIFVGIFWNRFGTPTKRADSGSVEEFRRAYEQWGRTRKPSLMLYFNRTASELSAPEELRQKLRLVEFKETLSGLGALARDYAGPEEFRQVIWQHLLQEVTLIESSDQVRNLRVRVDQQQNDLKEQKDNLLTLQFLIRAVVTKQEIPKLERLSEEGSFDVWFSWDMYNELKRLDDIEFVRMRHHDGLNAIKQFDGGKGPFNLKDFVEITPQGLQYLELRRELEKYSQPPPRTLTAGAL